jgi:hypothetical protein
MKFAKMECAKEFAVPMNSAETIKFALIGCVSRVA